MRLGYACQRQPCLRKKICRRKNIPQQSTGRKGSDQNILLSNKNRGNKNKTQVYRHLNPNHSSFIKRTLVQFQNFLLQMEVSQMHPVSGCGGCAQTRIHHRDHHSKTHVSKRSIRTFVPRSPFPSVDDKPSFFFLFYCTRLLLSSVGRLLNRWDFHKSWDIFPHSFSRVSKITTYDSFLGRKNLEEDSA